MIWVATYLIVGYLLSTVPLGTYGGGPSQHKLAVQFALVAVAIMFWPLLVARILCDFLALAFPPPFTLLFNGSTK